MQDRAGGGTGQLGVVGVSHRTAPIDVRERFHGAAEGLGEALTGRRAPALDGWVVLSTCNRVELYLSSTSLATTLPSVERLLAERSGLPPEEARGYLYRHGGRETVEHLFRVVAGLDSLVPGEAEIQGQVGDAYQEARLDRPGDVDPILHRLFQEALSAGGAVRTETEIGQGAASVPSAAVDLARKVFGSLAGRRAMVVGAGAMGRLTMTCLAAEGVQGTAVASRTIQRARELAAEHGGEPVALPSVPELLGDVDIVVSATSAAGHVVTEADLIGHEGQRGRPLVILDIAVPRDVSPGVDRLQEVFLYNIDDLQRVVEGAERSRLSQVPRAEEILREGVERFLRWHRGRQAVPMIRELRGRAHELRDRAVEELLAELERGGGGEDGPRDEEREQIREAFRRMVNRLLHEPTVALREVAARPDGERYLEAMRRLFDLDAGPADGRGTGDRETSGATDESEDGSDG